MNICLVSTHPIQYFSPLYRELTKRFPATHVLYLSERDATTPFVDPGFGHSLVWDTDLTSGLRTSSLGIAGLPYTYNARSLRAIFHGARRWLTAERPDVVLIPGWTPPYIAVLAAARAAGIPVITRPEARRSLGGVVKRLSRDQVARAFLRFTDAAAVIGTASRDELLRLGMRADRLFESPYTVDDQWWAAQRRSAAPGRAAARSQLGIAADDVTAYISVGKLQPYKRPVELITIFAEVHRKESRTHLLMVGDGPLADECASTIDRIGLQHCVTMCGFTNQSALPRLYSASDVFVLPSTETWGLVANEALAFGLPLAISSEAGSGRDLVLDGVTGYRLEMGNPQQVADRLVLLTDRKRRDKISANIRELSEKYTICSAVDGIVAACQAAVAGNR